MIRLLEGIKTIELNYIISTIHATNMVYVHKTTVMFLDFSIVSFLFSPF